MAIHVCYLSDEGSPDWVHSVIYLQQAFYELAHSLVDDQRAGPFLLRILTMGYGGSVLVESDRLQDLLVELDELESAIRSLPQLNDLRSAIRTAQQRKKALLFGGDMYPELDKELRHSREVVDCEKCGYQHKSPFWDVCNECGHIQGLLRKE